VVVMVGVLGLVGVLELLQPLPQEVMVAQLLTQPQAVPAQVHRPQMEVLALTAQEVAEALVQVRAQRQRRADKAAEVLNTIQPTAQEVAEEVAEEIQVQVAAMPTTGAVTAATVVTTAVVAAVEVEQENLLPKIPPAATAVMASS
jgi:DNA polymerase III gamma/tau subunit